MAGAAPRSATGWAGRLAGRVGDMEMIVADQARALKAQAPVAWRRLHKTYRWVPVDAYEPFAFTAFDQHFKALHRNKQLQSLRPFDRHAKRIIAAQIVELVGIFPLDRSDPQHFAFAVAVRLFTRGAGKAGEPLLSHEMQIVVVLL